jgi:hypothetical protein
VWVVAASLVMGCGAKIVIIGPGEGGTDAGSSDATIAPDRPEPVDGGRPSPDVSIDVVRKPDARRPCTGIACNVENCGTGTPTTVTGYVYAPNGTLPLYNVQVYIPNAPLAPFAKGVQCDNCGVPLSGSPITTALSDATGQFTLVGVPTGHNVPIVVQIGKWRRETSIPKVTGCSVNTLTDPNLTRLPRTQAEGNMPHIALTTGECDQMGCMLPKLGIDSTEFGVQSDGYNKAVNVYLGGAAAAGPTGATAASNLWGDPTNLDTYDIGIFSCECSESLSSKGGSDSSSDFTNVQDFLNSGGRILTADFQYVWYKYSPDPNVGGSPIGSNTVGIGEIIGGAPTGGSPITLSSSFPKATALTGWLKYVYSGVPLPSGATFPLDSDSQMGESAPDYVFSNIQSLDATKTMTWGTSPMPTGPRVFSMNTPVGVAPTKQCGKAVHIDGHVDTADGETVGSGYPTSGCNTTLKANEALYAFLLFDLSACIQDDTMAPLPPPPEP